MDFFHLLNRGVDKRPIVLDDKDRVRFIHDLFAFNDLHPSPDFVRPERRNESPVRPRATLVRIHAFCLMRNHYHLLVSEARENGIPLFMKKLNMGYAKYFNEKYQRVGALWQGKHKKILIERDAHFMYIPYYIHLNPLDYVMPQWREGKVSDPKAALEYLRAYRWSSHLDYLGERNFPSITWRDELSRTLGEPARYLKEIRGILTSHEFAQDSTSIE